VGDVEYLYLYPNYRVKADLKSLADLKSYEAFSCVAGDGKLGAATPIDRDAGGRPRYVWKPGAERLHPGRLRELASSGKLKPDEAWIQLHDFETGATVQAGRGSVYWNEFRRRWVMITTSNKPGEIWFAEADTPVGPWVYARRVVSHDNYNFYNPTQHPFFDQESGRLIYFEGTYTASFSGAKEKTPRYDYNQIVYRLALDDARLNLPVPVYRVQGRDGTMRYSTREGVEPEKLWGQIEDIAFFALPFNRGRGGTIPVFTHPERGHLVLSDTLPGNGNQPVFFALPATAAPVDDSVDGTWRCNLKDSDGGEFGITLELKADGEKVVGKASDDMVIRGGSFKAATLRLDVLHEEKAYALSASIGAGKLRGDWNRLDGGERGTWSGTRFDPVQPEDNSSAVVALYEYRNPQNDVRIYSTNAELADKTMKRSAAPLCRVWRNPMTVLSLDSSAYPVPLAK